MTNVSYPRPAQWMALTTCCAALFAVVFEASAALGTSAPSDWKHWRGPEATGAAPGAFPPLTWSEGGENILWKVPLPGRGHSTPVIAGDRLFITTAVDTGERVPGDRPHRGIEAASVQEFTLIALDRINGKELWRRVARRSVPHQGTHGDGTWASGSPATDGDYVIADFGSNGVYCYTVEGELVWEHDLGDMGTHGGFGEGSSPALYDEIVVVLFDHTGQSVIAAFDRVSGKELWRQHRDESANWSTPLVINAGGTLQVVANGGNRVRSYNLYTGKLIWEFPGMTGNATAMPVYADGVVYVATGFNDHLAVAIRAAGARGDVTGTPAVAWTYHKDTPYVPSPLLYGDYLYLLKKHTGILTCLRAGDGTVSYGPTRLELDPVFASPVGAAGRVYIAGRDGTVLVIKHGASYEVLATNKIDDEIYASPILIDDRLYLRGATNLYCISGD